MQSYTQNDNNKQVDLVAAATARLGSLTAESGAAPPYAPRQPSERQPAGAARAPAWHEPVIIDLAEVRRFVALIHEHVGQLAKRVITHDKIDPGRLQLVVINPDTGECKHGDFAIGDVESSYNAAVHYANAGWNVYIETRTVKNRKRKGRGGANDTVFCFALVVDLDRDKARTGQLNITPSLIVESSPGNDHRWLFFDRPWPPDCASKLGIRMRAAVGDVDACSGCITTPFRVTGTPNYPNAKKRARGRRISSTLILSHTDKHWAPDELSAAFPEVAEQRSYAYMSQGDITAEHVERIWWALDAIENNPPLSHEHWLRIVSACAWAATKADREQGEIIRNICLDWSNTARASRHHKPDDEDKQFNRAWAWAQKKREGKLTTLGTLFLYEKKAVAYWLAQMESPETIRRYLEHVGFDNERA